MRIEFDYSTQLERNQVQIGVDLNRSVNLINYS